MKTKDHSSIMSECQIIINTDIFNEDVILQNDIILGDIVRTVGECMHVGDQVNICDNRISDVEDGPYEMDMYNKRYEISVYQDKATLIRLS